MIINRLESKYAWDQLLIVKGGFDLYHTYDFHLAHGYIDKGHPALFHLIDSTDYIILPLLERDIDNSSLKDATSVYGYPGPLTNIIDPIRFSELWSSLCQYLMQEVGYITLFSRLNSLCVNECILNNTFDAVGQTINIDLTLSDAGQVNQYRSNHKRDIKRLIKNGFECSIVDLDKGLDDFIKIYNSTMSGLSASPYYFFPKSYYQKLFTNDLSELVLVRCKKGNDIACIGIFSLTNKIAQYHLGGTVSDYYKAAPTKLMFDYMRRYAMSLDFECLHLGGGLGGQNDNLFNFKRGFSDDVRLFYVCKQILDVNSYAELSLGKAPSDFFPLYRS